MSAFTDLPNGWAARINGIRYVTMQTVEWDIGHIGSGMTILIPAGFEFDMSIPRIMRWLINPHARNSLPAACVHDWLLYCQWDRPRAAAEFNLALKAYGIGPIKRALMFLAVAFYKWSARS